MRKSLLFLVMLLFSISTFAESKISEYRMTLLVDSLYAISSGEVNKGKFSFFIDGQTLDANNVESRVGFILHSKDLQKFKECMIKVKHKFDEWKIVAEDNNVKDYRKSFGIKLPAMSCYFHYADNVYLTEKYILIPHFNVRDNGVSYVSLKVENVASYSNRFIKHDGILIAFKTIEEIDQFLDALDTSLAINKTQSNNKTNSLFK